MERTRIIVEKTDDLIEKATGELTEATRTHVIELDGFRRQIDLTEANSTALIKALGPFLDAGYTPERQKAAPRPAQPGRNTLAEARRPGAGMKEYAAAHGIKITYEADGRKAYYSVALRKVWTEMPVAEQEQWIAKAQARQAEERQAQTPR